MVWESGALGPSSCSSSHKLYDLEQVILPSRPQGPGNEEAGGEHLWMLGWDLMIFSSSQKGYNDTFWGKNDNPQFGKCIYFEGNLKNGSTVNINSWLYFTDSVRCEYINTSLASILCS